MIGAMTLPERKVFETGYRFIDPLLKFVTAIYWIALQVPLHGLKVYPPVVLLSMSAAYASAQFATHRNVFPFPLNWAQAIAFEWVYIGVLAMASVKHAWFKRVLYVGAGTAIIYILLYAATRYGISPLIREVTGWDRGWVLATSVIMVLAHGIPLTVVNVFYGFLIHDHAVTQAAKQEEIDRRIYCPYSCGYYSTSEPAVRGHRAQCPNKPAKV